MTNYFDTYQKIMKEDRVCTICSPDLGAITTNKGILEAQYELLHDEIRIPKDNPDAFLSKESIKYIKNKITNFISTSSDKKFIDYFTRDIDYFIERKFDHYYLDQRICNILKQIENSKIYYPIFKSLKFTNSFININEKITKDEMVYDQYMLLLNEDNYNNFKIPDISIEYANLNINHINNIELVFYPSISADTFENIYNELSQVYKKYNLKECLFWDVRFPFKNSDNIQEHSLTQFTLYAKMDIEYFLNAYYKSIENFKNLEYHPLNPELSCYIFNNTLVSAFTELYDILCN